MWRRMHWLWSRPWHICSAKWWINIATFLERQTSLLPSSVECHLSCKVWAYAGLRFGHFRPHDSFCTCDSTHQQHPRTLALSPHLYRLAFNVCFLAISFPQHISPQISLPAAFGLLKAARHKGHVQPQGRRSRPKHQPCGIRAVVYRIPRCFVRLSLIFLLEYPLVVRLTLVPFYSTSCPPLHIKHRHAGLLPARPTLSTPSHLSISLIAPTFYPCHQQIGTLSLVAKLPGSPHTKPSWLKTLGSPILDWPASRPGVATAPHCTHYTLPSPTILRSGPIRRFRKDLG